MRVRRWFAGASRGRKDHESFRVWARAQAPRGGPVQVGRGADARRDDVTDADGEGAPRPLLSTPSCATRLISAAVDLTIGAVSLRRCVPRACPEVYTQTRSPERGKACHQAVPTYYYCSVASRHHSRLSSRVHLTRQPGSGLSEQFNAKPFFPLIGGVVDPKGCMLLPPVKRG